MRSPGVSTFRNGLRPRLPQEIDDPRVVLGEVRRDRLRGKGGFNTKQ
jgi:hypothetical protein